MKIHEKIICLCPNHRNLLNKLNIQARVEGVAPGCCLTWVDKHSLPGYILSRHYNCFLFNSFYLNPTDEVLGR